jgi:low temperature requirement protein LtrA
MRGSHSGRWGLVIEYSGPAARFWVPGVGRSSISDWNISGEHMAERCGLFIIIGLGESILVTGATFSGLVWDRATIAAFITAFAGSAAMWWVYFNATATFGSAMIAVRRIRAPGTPAYTYIHVVIVAGIVVTAVGDELSVGHPRGQAGTGTWLALAGGPMLFLAGILLFKWSVFANFPAPSLWRRGAHGALGGPRRLVAAVAGDRGDWRAAAVATRETIAVRRAGHFS